jgi:hypothetical protein
MLAAQRIDYSPSLFEQLRILNSDPDLSKGAFKVATEIVIASQSRGYCWHSVKALSVKTAQSERCIQLYLRELENRRYIVISRRPRRTNEYYLGERLSYAQSRPETNEVAPINEPVCTLNINVKEKEEINVNVVSLPVQDQPKIKQPVSGNLPSSKVADMGLIQEIERVTGDKRSRGCFIGIVRKCPESVVYAALSSLKVALSEGIVSKPGAYFVRTVQNLMLNTPAEDPPQHQHKRYVEPDEPVGDIASEEVARSSIAEIMVKLNQKVG